MDNLLRDLRHGVRSLLREPGFTLVAVLTLAVGIGASTAIFTVVDAVLLRGLPYRDSGRLAVLWVDFGEEGQSMPAASSLDFRDLRDWTRRFAGLAAGFGRTANLTGEGDPEQVELGEVTYDFFPLLGVEPARGRGFLESEDVQDGPAVVILSHRLWSRRFGADPGVIGKTILLDDRPREVVGVLPAGFQLLAPPEGWLKDADLWAPLQDPYAGPRNRTLVTVLGRLADDATFAQAQEEMSGFAAHLREEYPVHQESDTRIRVVPLHEDIVKDVRRALLLLLGAAGLVLLIACGNVASLLLARGAGREREISIRVALGAGRGRVAQQVLSESGLLSLGGGLLGLLLAQWGVGVLLALRPAHLPRLEDVGIDGTALAFTAAISFLTVVLFGLLPAVRASRPQANLNAFLKEGGRSPDHAGSQAMRRMVVIGEVAMSLVLLIGAGLLVRSFALLQDVRPGFDSRGVLTFRLSLPRNRYPTPQERIDFYGQLEQRLHALPGVQAVGAVSRVPLSAGGWQAPYAFDERTAQNWESVTADAREVTADYFSTLGIRRLEGRLFDERDVLEGQPVVIVDEMLARRAWPGGEAVGKRIQLPMFGPEGVRREWIEVIGVVEHVRNHDLARDVREEVYFPHRQGGTRTMDVVVRGAGDPANLANAIRSSVHALDKDLPVHHLRPLSDDVADAAAQSRFTVILIGTFGAIALLMAIVGLYGVISYMVGHRTYQFGVRLALGAQGHDILRLVLVQGLRLTVVGIAAGLAIALATARAFSSLLFGVSATDPLTFLGIPLLLLFVALLACYLPARRASHVDPMVALREE